eukprot:COSAG06_NODE_4875_length_3888_cov_11.473740_6_plen_93_part_00
MLIRWVVVVWQAAGAPAVNSPDTLLVTEAQVGHAIRTRLPSRACSTANCIIIDHFSAFEPGLVAPFLTLRDKNGSSQNAPKFEHRRVSKPFL